MLLRRHANKKNVTKKEDLDVSAEKKVDSPKSSTKKQTPKKAGE